MNRKILAIIVFMFLISCQSSKEKQNIEEEKKVINQLNELSYKFTKKMYEKTMGDIIDSLLLVNEEFYVPNSVMMFYEPKIKSMQTLHDEFQRKLILFKEKLALNELSRLADVENQMLDYISSLENHKEQADELNSLRRSTTLFHNYDKQLIIIKRNSKIIDNIFKNN